MKDENGTRLFCEASFVAVNQAQELTSPTGWTDPRATWTRRDSAVPVVNVGGLASQGSSDSRVAGNAECAELGDQYDKLQGPGLHDHSAPSDLHWPRTYSPKPDSSASSVIP